jgi:hypothetical protein
MREPDVETIPVNLEVTVLPGGFLSRPDAARFLGLSSFTLWNWAKAGIGPPWQRAGRRLSLYRITDLEAFRDARGRAA